MTIVGVKPLALNIIIGIAATVLIAAVVFQIGVRPGGFLRDLSAPIQGHALWHCFSALAFVVAVRTINIPEGAR